jgi:hypothetical protein
MATEKRSAEDQDELISMNFRAPRWLVDALDGWTAEMNETSRWPKMKRPDLVRGVLEWAVRTRPDWETGLAELKPGQPASQKSGRR